MKKLKQLIFVIFIFAMFTHIIAGCTANTAYKVNFIVDDTVYYTTETAGNTDILLPSNPQTESNYTFEGWFRDKDIWNIPFTSDSLRTTPLTESLSVYAYFKPINTEPIPAEYTVTYDACGGELEETFFTVTEGESYTLSVPLLEGYAFDGWYNEARGNGEKYTDEDGISLAVWSDKENITLYANWVIIAKKDIPLQTAVNAANEGDTIRIEEGIYTEALTVNKDGLKFIGNGTVIIQNRVIITGDNLTFYSINFSFIYGEEGLNITQENAPINANGKTLTLLNCIVERATDAAQPYGWLVEADILNARNTVFTAPYENSKVFEKSPSVIKAQGGLFLDDCVIQTNGYGFFDVWVTKGEIKNTVFEGVNGLSAYSHINSLKLDGLTLDGCTFLSSVNALITGGSYTIKDSIFDNTSATSNALYIYIYNTAEEENANIIIDNNIFKLNSFLGGICFSGADWAPSIRDISKISVINNVFQGKGRYALRQYNSNWDLISEATFPQNDFNDNNVENT